MKVLRFLFILIIVISFLGAVGFGVYKTVFYMKESKYNENLKEIASGYIDENYQVDFDSLKEINQDVIGYLVVKGTKITYPVVKTQDNNFYLEHSLDKSVNLAGWIFANSGNTFDGFDINIAIFGSERFDGSMFGSLKDTLTSKWQVNNKEKQVIFITKDEISYYDVFSTYKMPKEDYYIKNTFPNNDEYQEFLNLLKERSNHDYGVEVTTEDQILTLATINKKEQYVLHAKKIIENN